MSTPYYYNCFFHVFKKFFFGSTNFSLFFVNLLKSKFFFYLFFVGSDYYYNYNILKLFCLKKKIFFIQIKCSYIYNNFLNYNLYFFVKLKFLNFNISLIIDYGFFFSLFFLRISKNGILNTHFSILPLYRGFWPLKSIKNKNILIGISLIYLNFFLDFGSIVFFLKKNFFNYIFLYKNFFLNLNIFFKIKIFLILKKIIFYIFKNKKLFNFKQLFVTNFHIFKMIK